MTDLNPVREADIEQTFEGLLRYLDMEQDDPDEYGWSPLVKQGYLMAMRDALEHARPIIDSHITELKRLRAEVAQLLAAIRRALNELGVPNEDTSAPVANAVAILTAATQGEET